AVPVLLPLRTPPSSTLFPYTTLFRSRAGVHGARCRNKRRPNHRAARQLCIAHRAARTRATRKSDGSTTCNCSSTATGCNPPPSRSEEHTSELQSPCNLVCRLLLEKKN